MQEVEGGDSCVPSPFRTKGFCAWRNQQIISGTIQSQLPNLDVLVVSDCQVQECHWLTRLANNKLLIFCNMAAGQLPRRILKASLGVHILPSALPLTRICTCRKLKGLSASLVCTLRSGFKPFLAFVWNLFDDVYCNVQPLE